MRPHIGNITRDGFALLYRMRQAGWRKKNAAAKLHLSLSLIARCTPSLTDGSLYDDRLEGKAGKDCNCCHYKPFLMSSHTHQQHKGEHGADTHYLNVVIGRAKGETISEKAHRIMCYAWHGPPHSHQLIVRHICSNRGGTCLNPYHLQWDSVAANNADVHALIKERTSPHARSSNEIFTRESSQDSSEIITII